MEIEDRQEAGKSNISEDSKKTYLNRNYSYTKVNVEYFMEDLVTISANLGTKEDPIIVQMGISTQAYSIMEEMLEKEPIPVSNERWNKIMFEASKRYPPEKNKRY